MGQITATRNLVATKVVRLAGQLVTKVNFLQNLTFYSFLMCFINRKNCHETSHVEESLISSQTLVHLSFSGTEQVVRDAASKS